MKIKGILAISASLSLPLLISPNISMKSETKVNQKDENEYNFIKLSELKRIERIDGKRNNLVYSKIINSIFDKKYLFMQFRGIYSIVDIENFNSIEIRWDEIEQETFSKNEIVYVDAEGLYISNGIELTSLNDNDCVIKDYKELLIQNRSKINSILKLDIGIKIKNLYSRTEELLNKKIKDVYDRSNEGTNYNSANIANVSTLTPNAWWWATRDSTSKIGYDDLLNTNNGNVPPNKAGLCEYVAMANLFLYHELFTVDNLFDSNDWNYYINNRHDIVGGLEIIEPQFKYHYWLHPEHSLTKTLYRLNNKEVNLKTSLGYYKVYDQFVKNKSVRNKLWIYGQYFGYWQAWHNVKKGNPTILGVATFNWFNHAMLAYGYDDRSDMFLVSYLWGSKKSTRVLHSYNTPVIGSYMFSMGLKDEWKGHKKLEKPFQHNGIYKSGEEISKLVGINV